jgi:DNA-binding beta-propeller fold protein YncE
VANPAASLLVPLKISPDVPLSGQDRFDAQYQPLVRGLYQVAYSPKHDRAFVTSAVGRPPVTVSELLKVNPQTLAIEARVTPAVAPAPARSGADAGNAAASVYAVYGVDVDDAHDRVWVTNTRQNTVAVYRQSDLKLVKQFEPGTVPHARDVLVDERRGKVYASPVGEPRLVVFDAATLKPGKPIAIATTRRGADAKDFSPMSLALDEAGARLFVVSLSTAEVAVIDTRTDRVTQVWPLEGVNSAAGVAYDPQGDRILVAAQGSDNLLIVDAKTGKTLHDVKTGAGALNVSFDPVHRLAYVANRGSGTVTVVDANGQIVANLAGGTLPNHLKATGKGTVLTVNKSRGENDPAGDRIGRITPR